MQHRCMGLQPARDSPFLCIFSSPVTPCHFMVEGFFICSAGIESGPLTCKKKNFNNDLLFCIFKNWGMIAHAFNPIIWEADTGRSFWVWGQDFKPEFQESQAVTQKVSDSKNNYNKTKNKPIPQRKTNLKVSIIWFCSKI